MSPALCFGLIIVVVIIIILMHPMPAAKEALTDAERVVLRNKYRNAVVGLDPSPEGYATFKSRLGATKFSPLGFTQIATANKKGVLTDAILDAVINR